MKRRYLTLDAMRGVAAVAVFFHHGNAISAPFTMPAGYRAVDLFFVLSGFVLAHAYEDRLRAGHRLRSFMAQRLLRLYPLYLLGAAIGIGGAVLALLLGGGNLDARTLVVGSVALLLFLPSPTWATVGALMPLNVPGWSLFFELVANVVYVVLAPFLGRRVLVGVVIAAAVFLLVEASRAGTTNLGSDWVSFPGGMARVLFSFFAGVLIYRVHARRAGSTRLAWIIPLLTLPLLYLLSENLAADLLCVFVAFPVMILLGARFDIGGTRVAGTLGDVSYGIYITHVPLILLAYKAFSFLHSDANAFAPWTGLVLISALFVAMIGIDRWYDRPVRRWIAGRFRLQGWADVAPRDTPLGATDASATARPN